MDVKSYIISVLDTCKMISSSPALLPVSDHNGVGIDVTKGSKFVAQYGRFQTIAARLKPLLTQLENRTEKSYEYVDWFKSSVRKRLIYLLASLQHLIHGERLQKSKGLWFSVNCTDTNVLSKNA